MLARKSAVLRNAAVMAALILVLACGNSGLIAGPAEKQSIMIKGSDTMIHLVSAWAETYMQKDPSCEISVTGGGSGTGIAALLNGTTDICSASRTMQPKEYEQAKANNVAPKEIVVARDGIAIAVNPSNPLKEITMDQLEKIFTGAWTNWNQLGGPNQEIEVLSRESSSGTYVFFQEHVMKKKDYTPKARLLPATSAIVQGLTADKTAIGYVGLGYAAEAGSRIKVLPVKANDTAPAIVASEATVKSGQYPVARPLFLYVNGEPKGLVKKFIDFCLSPEGQEIVRQQGYVTAN
jgi:phosphate transport system substrate-binding protein